MLILLSIGVYYSVLLIYRLFIENEATLSFDPIAAKLGTGAPIKFSNLQWR